MSVQKNKRRRDLAERIYRQLGSERGMDDAERWQHALFFAMSPQERCHFSLKTARSALSLRRSGKKRFENVPVKVLPLRRVIASKRASNREKDLAVLPILERTLRLRKRLRKRQRGTPKVARRRF